MAEGLYYKSNLFPLSLIWVSIIFFRDSVERSPVEPDDTLVGALSCGQMFVLGCQMLFWIFYYRFNQNVVSILKLPMEIYKPCKVAVTAGSRLRCWGVLTLLYNANVAATSHPFPSSARSLHFSPDRDKARGVSCQLVHVRG